MKKKRTGNHGATHAKLAVGKGAKSLSAKASVVGGKTKIRLRRRVTLAALLGALACLTVYAIRTSNAKAGRAVAPMVTVNKTAALAPGGDVNSNGHVNPGDKLAYSVTVANNGTEALGVVFTDQLDPNLTLEAGSVKASPIATNDSYASLGNVGINVPAGSGVLVNDVNPQGVGTLSVTTTMGATTQGGTFAINADGSFSYNPPVGFVGADSFIYTLTHSNGLSDMGTVSFNVSGMIWFVNNNAGACASNCNGRLSNPFTTLTAFNTANGLSGGLNPDSNDKIFVYESGTQYTGAVTLRTGQKLIGQDATTTLASIAGITPPAHSNILPTLDGANGTITNLGSTVTLNTNTTVRGLNINSTTSTGMNDPAGAITGVSVSELAIVSTTGTAVALSDVGGTFTLRSVSANGGVNGMALTNTTGSFMVTGDGGGANNGSGGLIQNTTGAGITLSNAQNVSFDQLNIQNTARSGIRGSHNVSNFAFTNGTINNVATAIVGGENDGNISFDTFPVDGDANHLQGTVTITGSTLNNSAFHGIWIQNYSGTISDLNISNNTLVSVTTAPASSGSGISVISFGHAGGSSSITKGTIDNNIVNHFPGGLGIQMQGGNVNEAQAGGSYGTFNDPTNVISISNNKLNDPAQGATAGVKFGGEGMVVLVNGRGQGNFAISNNRVFNTTGIAISHSAFGDATVSSTVNGNTIVANNTFAAQGIGVGTGTTGGFANNAPTMQTTINNNNISQVDGNGILALTRANTAGVLNVTIKGNTVAAPLTGVRPGIRVDAGGSTSVDDDVCLDIGGTVPADQNTSAGSGGSQGIGLRKQGTDPAANAFGLEGLSPSPAGTPTVENFVNSRNPAGGGTLLISATSGFTSCASAPLWNPVDAGGGANSQATDGSAPSFLTRAWQWVASFFSA